MTGKVAKLQIYTYKGVGESGAVVSGEINAISIPAAKALLRKQGITPKKVNKRSLSFLKKRPKKIKSKDITFFTRQLATMLTSGIPLIQGFDIVGKGLANPSMRNLVAKIRSDVEEGHTFVEALQKYPDHFNELYCSLVGAGEQSGALDGILDKLATQKEKTESIKGKIRKALFYPAAVIIIALVVTAILLIFVVPQFENLFKGFGAELPFFTRLVIQLSKFVQSYWWVILGIIVGTMWGFLFAKRRSPKFSNALERSTLKMPIIGGLLVKAAIARFTRTLATTFSAGVPLVDGLQSVAKATGNVVFENATMQISADLSKGQQLQHAMRASNLFPEMVIQMITIGEESGALDKMLTKVADFYEEEVDNTVESLSSLIEPLIIAILGVLVGGLVVAMYLPIFKLGSVV